MKYILYSARPKQWVKNLFVFLPLVFGKKLFVYPENAGTAAAFLLFTAASAAAYLINDIMDQEKDRTHPLKRLRPIASGKLTKRTAALAASLSGTASVALSFLLDMRLGLIISAYLVFNFVYTRFLKDVVIIDIFCIGAFFLLRLLAGSVAAKVSLSHWIILMTVLLALFLGFNKRRQELRLLKKNAASHRPVLTMYSAYFIDQIIAVVTSSIVIAYALYAQDARTVSEFGTDRLIISVPFVYYGIFRYLYIIHRLRKEGDPTRILLSDRPMQINILLWISVCIGIIYFGG